MWLFASSFFAIVLIIAMKIFNKKTNIDNLVFVMILWWIPSEKNFNPLDFEANFFTNNSWKFEAAKVTENFPIFKFSEVAFPNLRNFLANI